MTFPTKRCVCPLGLPRSSPSTEEQESCGLLLELDASGEASPHIGARELRVPSEVIAPETLALVDILGGPAQAQLSR